MKYLSAVDIVASCKDVPEKMKRRAIEMAFMIQDESHLWPIKSHFNATKRAVRRVKRFESQTEPMDLLSYALAIETEISRIVNDESNW